MRKIFSVVGALSLVMVSQPLNAQGGSDIYIVPIEVHGTHIVVGRPKNATKRAGYDNQPSFTPDGSTVLFTSIREDAQSDIWKVSVDGGDPVRYRKNLFFYNNTVYSTRAMRTTFFHADSNAAVVDVRNSIFVTPSSSQILAIDSSTSPSAKVTFTNNYLPAGWKVSVVETGV